MWQGGVTIDLGALEWWWVRGGPSDLGRMVYRHLSQYGVEYAIDVCPSMAYHDHWS